jgi:hypothetical protein
MKSPLTARSCHAVAVGRQLAGYDENAHTIEFMDPSALITAVSEPRSIECEDVDVRRSDATCGNTQRDEQRRLLQSGGQRMMSFDLRIAVPLRRLSD